jgi:hypothetical protein
MTSPYEHPDQHQLLDDELIPYTLAVGALCNHWASLESATRMLFFKASGMPMDNRASFGIVHCLAFRDLIAAIRLSFVENTKSRPDVTKFALDTFHYIDSILRLRRNRYVHDIWHYDEQAERVERVTYVPRIRKPQAREPLDWTPMDFNADDIDDLWNTVREVRDHSDILRELQDAFNEVYPAEAKARLEELLKSPPQRRFLPHQSGKPSPSDND